MSEKIKMEYPEFVHTICIVKSSENEEIIKVRLRFNPFHITSYVESVYNNKGEYFPCTFLYCGGTGYNVDMKIDEFDKMMGEIEKSVQLKDN